MGKTLAQGNLPCLSTPPSAMRLPTPALATAAFVAALAAAPAAAQAGGPDPAGDRLVPAPSAPAAARGGCALGEAEATLDANAVRATLYNTGGLFWRGAAPVYEVPAGSGRHPVFAAGLWVGGTVAGEVRFAGATYRNWEFWPGPIGPDGATTPERCAAFDRIWVVSQADLDAYGGGQPPTADLAEWPVAQGAPFFVDADGDGRRGIAEPVVELDLGDDGYSAELGEGRQIDLAAGERPLVHGSQTAWWVVNDVGGAHAWSGSAPLGVEVRVQAVAVADPERPALHRATVYRYAITNRSGASIDGLRSSFFADVHVGHGDDDYFASDTTRSMMIGYNGAESDSEYGATPPAVGVDVLSGAVSTYFDNEPIGPATVGDGAYAWMNGRSASDGSPIRRGGSGEETLWFWDGDPVARAFWTMENHDGAGWSLQPRDVSGIVTAAHGALGDGETATFDLAILYARGDSRLHSVTRLREASDEVQALYDAGALLGTASLPPVAGEAAPDGAELSLAVHPNPASGRAEVPFALAASADVRLSVVDALGREVAVLADGPHAAGDHAASLDAGSLAAGVYVVRLRGDGAHAVRRLTVVR